MTRYNHSDYEQLVKSYHTINTEMYSKNISYKDAVSVVDQYLDCQEFDQLLIRLCIINYHNYSRTYKWLHEVNNINSLDELDKELINYIADMFPSRKTFNRYINKVNHKLRYDTILSIADYLDLCPSLTRLLLGKYDRDYVIRYDDALFSDVEFTSCIRNLRIY